MRKLNKRDLTPHAGWSWEANGGGAIGYGPQSLELRVLMRTIKTFKNRYCRFQGQEQRGDGLLATDTGAALIYNLDSFFVGHASSF